MQRREFLCGCGCCGLLTATPAVALADGEWRMPARFQRPEAGGDEGGLWALLDREEAKLKRSRFIVRDKALNDYLAGIACRLAGDHCADVRVYVVRTPIFNASMAPNGMLQIWTGLLLRMANEAQLAAVLGHEIGHYLARHSLDRLRDAKSRSAFGQFLGMALAAAGAGNAGLLAQLALAAGSFSYSREHEREADRIGLELMAGAGYAPMEASKVWDQLLGELKAESDWTGDPAKRSVLFASHPPEDERRDALATRAAALTVPQASVGGEQWRQVMAPHQWDFLEDELHRRRSGESLALLDRLIAASPTDGVLQYFRGEAYRLRAAEGDRPRALDAYELAEQQANAPVELYRSRGMLLRAAGDEAGARQAFARYLSLRPTAEDAELIDSYLKQEIR
jgi:predicted Zn-dependent protease